MMKELMFELACKWSHKCGFKDRNKDWIV